MNTKIVLSILLTTGVLSQVFSEDFEAYYTGTVYNTLPFSGKWYRQDVNKTTGNFEVRNSGDSTTTVLSLFVENITSVTCIDITTQPSYIYQLQMNYALAFGTLATLTISWNQQSYTYTLSDSLIYDFSEEVEAFNSNNTLCFSGWAPNVLMAFGPIIDNITLTSLRPISEAPHQDDPSESQQSEYQSSISSLISSGIKSYTQMVKVMGFGYLISNLLNYWNLIVLYYFLNLQPIPDDQRVQFERLCQISVSQSSIFGFLSWISPFESPEITTQFQKIPKSSNQWTSYSEMGLSSNIVKNNIETYAMISLCLVKIGIFSLLKKALTQVQPCCIPSSFLRIKWKEIFLYEIITETPNLVFPAAIMLSSQSSFTSSTLKELFNNFVVMTGFLLCIFVISLNYILASTQRTSKKKLLEEKKKIGEMRRKFEKKLKEPSIIFDKYSMESNLPTFEKELQQKELAKKYEELSRSMTKNEFRSQKAKLDLLDHILFFTIPFLLGFGQRKVFFGINAVILVKTLVFLIKNHKIFRMFEKKEYYIRIFMKVNWITYHVIHFMIYLNQNGNLGINDGALFNLCSVSLFLVLSGAVVESLNSLVDLIGWVFQTFKSLCRGKNKIVDQKNTRFEQKISPIIPFKRGRPNQNESKQCEKTNGRLSIESIQTKVFKSKKKITTFEDQCLNVPKSANKTKVASNMEIAYNKATSNIFDIEHFSLEFRTQKLNKKAQQ